MSISKLPAVFTERLSGLPEPLTIVLNDSTRPSSAHHLQTLEPFLPKMSRILFATGAHRPVSENEGDQLLGRLHRPFFDVQSNICDDGSHVYIGSTSSGTPVEFHPWLLEGSILALNTVEPHYFAGFTGGRKSFLPGCSSRRTIVANHYLACLPGALPGKLRGNPVNDDMTSGASMLYSMTETLMINAVAEGNMLFAGLPGESFLAAAEEAGERYGIPVRRRFDSLEVRPGGTLEVSLYQSMKAVFLWADSVRDGGDLVLSAPCPEGLGAPHMERILRASGRTVAQPTSRSEYSLGDHAAIYMSRIRRRLNLSFRTGVDLSGFGFPEPPAYCVDTVYDAGFTYPVIAEENA